MNGNETYVLIAFLGYFSVLITIAWITKRFSSSSIGAFFVGGRMMDKRVVAISSSVSGYSAWLMLGLTGMAFIQGASAIWYVIGVAVGDMLLLLYVAPKMRRHAGKHNCITIPDIFTARFKDENGLLRLLIVVIFFVFLGSYLSAQFIGGVKTFSASFNIDQNIGVIITASIVLLYTLFGGFYAVSLTDVIQALLMIIGLIIVPIYVIFMAGGLEIVLMQLKALDPRLVNPMSAAASVVIGGIAVGLGTLGNPHKAIRYMSIKHVKDLGTSAVVGLCCNVLLGWGAVYVGLVGRYMFPELDMLTNGDEEMMFIQLTSTVLHPMLYGVVLASIFAALMSTADSQLLILSSSVVRDVYQKIFHKNDNITEKKLVFLSRLVIFITILVALMFTFFFEDIIFSLVLFSWGGLGAAIGPALLFTLFWKHATRLSIMCGMLMGLVVSIGWSLIPALDKALYELIPAFYANTMTIIIVSLWQKRMKVK